MELENELRLDLAIMAFSEFDCGTYCSILNILNRWRSKVVFYLLPVVRMMRLGEGRDMVFMLQLVVLNE